MAMRRHATSVVARDIGLEEGQDMSKILIFDHLTPRMQELYGTAKSFKTRFGFQFCWAKNGTIFHRKSENSRPLKVRSPDVFIGRLNKLLLDNFASLVSPSTGKFVL